MTTRLVPIGLALATGGCALFWDAPGTPLGLAAHRGDIAAIRTLIGGGADPDGFDASGQTALHWAARGGHRAGPHHCRGEAPDRADVVAALVDAGANPNLADRGGAIPERSPRGAPRERLRPAKNH